MKKQPFITELNRELGAVPPHIREEIINDIHEHFAEGAAQGMSEEEVCRKLGQPAQIAAQVMEEYGEYTREPDGFNKDAYDKYEKYDKFSTQYEDGRERSQNNKGVDFDNMFNGLEQVFEGIGNAFSNVFENIDESIGGIFGGNSRETQRAERKAERDARRYEQDYEQNFHQNAQDDYTHYDPDAQSRKIKGGYEINIDETFLNPIHNIRVKLTNSKIRFVPAPDGRFRVTIQGRSRYDRFNIRDDGGELTVMDNFPAIRFEIFPFKNKLETTIYVPGQFNGNIKARSSVGNISASGISGQLDFKTAAGNVDVENHHGRKIELRSAAGNINAHLASQRIDELTISTAAGNAKVTAEETGYLCLKSAAGNVDAKINRLGNDSIITTAAGSADVTAYEVAGNIEISTSAGSAKIRLPIDVNCRIHAKKPGVGSLRNELRGNPDSPYTLRASSGVGSVYLKAI